MQKIKLSETTNARVGFSAYVTPLGSLCDAVNCEEDLTIEYPTDQADERYLISKGYRLCKVELTPAGEGVLCY